jgi:hypothetical protein
MHFLLLSIAANAAAVAISAISLKLGQTDFEISCNSEASKSFQTGLKWMHLFGTDEAKESFDDVLKADSDCKMAYYGLAMIQKLPLWHSENVTAANEYLENLKCENEKECGITRREFDYVQSAKIYFAENIPIQEREKNYSLKMKQLAKDYPSDVDASALYALSLLAESQNAPEFITLGESVDMVCEARLILDKYVKISPDHPGILHYLSHAYDDPDSKVAKSALAAGKHLQDVASSSTHAVHMASHITLAMGNWTDSLEINRQAYGVAVQSCASKYSNPIDIEFCDRENKYHALEWVHYTLLMQCRRDEALEVIKEFQEILNRNPNLIPYQDWMLKMYSRQAVSSPTALNFIPSNHRYADKWWLPMSPCGTENNSYWDIFAEAGALYARGMDLIKLNDITKTDILTVIDQKLVKLVESAKNISYVEKYAKALQLALKACTVRLTCLPGDVGCLSQSILKWEEALAIDASNPRDATSPTLPIEPIQEAFGRFILRYGHLFENYHNVTAGIQPTLEVAVEMFEKTISVWGPRPACVFGLTEANKRLENPAGQDYSQYFVDSNC